MLPSSCRSLHTFNGLRPHSFPSLGSVENLWLSWVLGIGSHWSRVKVSVSGYLHLGVGAGIPDVSRHV